MKCRILLLFVMLLFSVGMPLLAQEEEVWEPDLTIGVLPVINVLPFFGEPLGYFEEEGVAVRLMWPVFSAQELREGIASGELDGFQADLITTLILIEEGYDVRLVRHVGLVSPPLFGILAHEASGIMSVEDLAGARIGISDQTAVQYVTDLMLLSAGVDPADVEYVNIPGIEDRYQMLAAGEIEAATLPQPFYTLSARAGAQVLIDDSVLDYVPEAIGFLAETLAEKGAEVRAFLSGYERTLHEFNARETFAEGIAWIGAEFQNTMQNVEESGDEQVMVFVGRLFEAGLWPSSMTTARVPTEEEFAQVQDWALAAGLVTEVRAYEDVVDGSFLPEMMDDEMDMDDDMDDMSEEDEE